jgi:biotin transport system substrate-specific component
LQSIRYNEEVISNIITDMQTLQNSTLLNTNLLDSIHPLSVKIITTLSITMLTALLAQVSFRLPFSEVPVTGQTFAVLLAGVLLGRGWGGMSQVLYVLLGIAGMPWFAGWKGGMAVLAGPTGGYLLGFMVAPLLIGFVIKKFPQTKSLLGLTILLLLTNFLVIHGFGLLQLASWMGLYTTQTLHFMLVFAKGTAPFIVGDMYKIGAVVCLGQLVLKISSAKKE